MKGKCDTCNEVKTLIFIWTQHLCLDCHEKLQELLKEKSMKGFCDVCSKLSFDLTYRWNRNICPDCIGYVHEEVRKEYGNEKDAKGV